MLVSECNTLRWWLALRDYSTPPWCPLVEYHQVWVCGKALGWINRDETRTKPAPTPRLPVGTGEPIFLFRQ